MSGTGEQRSDRGAEVFGRRRTRPEQPRIEPLDPRRPRRRAEGDLSGLSDLPAQIAESLSERLSEALRRPTPVEADDPLLRVWEEIAREEAWVWVEPLAAEDGGRAAVLADAALADSFVEEFLGGPLERKPDGPAEDGDPGESAEAAAEAEGGGGEETAGGARDGEPDARHGTGNPATVEESGGSAVRYGNVTRAALSSVVETLARTLSATLRPGAPPFRPEGDTSRSRPERALRRHDSVVAVPIRIDGGAVRGRALVCAAVDAVQRPGVSNGETERRNEKAEDVARALDVDVAVVVGRASVRLDALARLAAGDVIVLDRRVGEPLEARAEGRKLFRGLPGRVGGRLALRVVDVREERRRR